MSLSEALHQAIHDFRATSGKYEDPTIILMHPHTWTDLEMEVPMAMMIRNPNIREFMGITVYRSHDIEPRKFKVA